MARSCRLCGCTEAHACLEAVHAGTDRMTPCGWEPGLEDVCTACARAWHVLEVLQQQILAGAHAAAAFTLAQIAAREHRFEVEARASIALEGSLAPTTGEENRDP